MISRLSELTGDLGAFTHDGFPDGPIRVGARIRIDSGEPLLHEMGNE